MRKLLLLLPCLLLCACGGADPVVQNHGTNQAPANTAPANTTPSAARPTHALAAEIDTLHADIADLASRVKAASPDELKGERKKGFTEESKAIGERAESLDKRVAESGDDELKQYWESKSAEMKKSGEAIGEALGFRAESERVKSLLDIKQLGDLQMALQMIMVDDAKKKRLKDAKNAEKRGLEFWEFACKRGLIDREFLPKMVSLNSSDKKSDGSFVDGEGVLKPENCSYTAPMVHKLLWVMYQKGKQRTVVIAFNSRNWNNYPSKGVLVLWSDGDLPVYMTADEAKRDWEITAEEWADPAGKLFGKKAPFDHTYE